MEPHLDEIIGIDLIADEILKNFSTKDLLNLALLNKKWNRIARDYLYYRSEKSTLQLVLVENRESNLERVEWLQTSPQKIFKQLSISIYSCYSQHDCGEDFWTLLKKLQEAPLRASGITSLEVSDNCHHSGKCEATEFMKSVIRHLPQNSIQHVNTKFVKDFNSLFLEKDQFIFPDLQSINLSVEHLENLHLIPSLKEFSRGIQSQDLKLILDQGMAHIVKNLILDNLPSSDGSEMNTILRFAESRPRLKSLIVFDVKIRDLLIENNKALTRALQLILESSFLSLEELWCKVDLHVLNTIWTVSKRSFPKVRTIRFPQQQLFEAEILGTIPLAKLFPNLSTVVLCHVKHFKIDRNVLEDSWEFEGTEVCSTVRTLHFAQFKYQYRFRSEFNKILAKIFPNVKFLKCEFVRDEQELVSFCSSLWPGIWEGLERITISLVPAQLYACEWCFLGISKQEWKYWLELKKSGVNLTFMQFPPSDDSLSSLSGVDFLIEIFSKSGIPESPSDLLSLTELEPNLFRLGTCIGSEVQPTLPIEQTPQTLSVSASRLINGLQNQISRLWRIG